MLCCKQGFCGYIPATNIEGMQTEDIGFVFICNISYEVCMAVSLFSCSYSVQWIEAICLPIFCRDVSLAMGSRKIAPVPVK